MVWKNDTLIILKMFMGKCNLYSCLSDAFLKCFTSIYVHQILN